MIDGAAARRSPNRPRCGQTVRHDFCCGHGEVGVRGRKETVMEPLILVCGLLAGVILVWAALQTGRG
jgi:hypothetical protein